MEMVTSRDRISADLNFLRNHHLPWHLKILLGGGFLQQMEQGIYLFSPMGCLMLGKLERLISESFLNAGAKEIRLPMVQSKGLWDRSGRIVKFAGQMARASKDLIVSPSHEEIVCHALGRNLSYKHLPFSVFHVGRCFREEIRPKNGLLRSREFVLCDSYTLSQNSAQHEEAYQNMKRCLADIFRKLGLIATTAWYRTADEESLSEEFVVMAAHIGEKRVLHCLDCGQLYRASQFQVCPCSGKNVLQRGIEFADLIRCGTSFSANNGSGYIDRAGEKQPYYLLATGIGVTKLLAVLIEASYGQEFVWPSIIAPFQAALVPARGAEQNTGKIRSRLQMERLDVLVDDRDLSVGRRVAELKMLGIPNIIIVKRGDDPIESIKRSYNLGCSPS